MPRRRAAAGGIGGLAGRRWPRISADREAGTATLSAALAERRRRDRRQAGGGCDPRRGRRRRADAIVSAGAATGRWPAPMGSVSRAVLREADVPSRRAAETSRCAAVRHRYDGSRMRVAPRDFSPASTVAHGRVRSCESGTDADAASPDGCPGASRDVRSEIAKVNRTALRAHAGVSTHRRDARFAGGVSPRSCDRRPTESCWPPLRRRGPDAGRGASGTAACAGCCSAAWPMARSTSRRYPSYRD